MIRVVIVDDHALIRKGLRGLLELTEDIRVVAEAADGEAAVRLIPEQSPDVVLLDVQLPRMNGLEVLRALQAGAGLPPTILLTTFDRPDYLLEGLRAGAKGFLLKDVSLERMAEAIRQVQAGHTCFRPGVSERGLQSLKQAPVDFESLEQPTPLTPREIEVLALMAGGYANREIADMLGASEGTVKNHVSSILSKLGVRDRIHAVFRGLELGLV